MACWLRLARRTTADQMASRIGNQVDAAMILAAADFLSLDGLMSRKRNKTKV